MRRKKHEGEEWERLETNRFTKMRKKQPSEGGKNLEEKKNYNISIATA